MVVVDTDELGGIFTESLIEVVSTISSLSIDVLSTERDMAFDEIVSAMSLNSSRGGLLFLSAGCGDMRTFCAYMTGAHGDEITLDDMRDTLCELLNMTAGNAKVRLQDTELMFSLSTPVIISGKDISVISKKRSAVISRRLGNEEVSVKLIAVY